MNPALLARLERSRLDPGLITALEREFREARLRAIREVFDMLQREHIAGSIFSDAMVVERFPEAFPVLVAGPVRVKVTEAFPVLVAGPVRVKVKA